MQLVRSAAASKRILDLLDGAQATDPAESTPTSSGANADVAKPGAATRRTAGSFAASSPAETGTAAESLVAKGLVIGWPGGPELSAPIDLAVGRGSSLAVVGPSGIGKTTLLYTLAGMLEPKAGSVLLGGRPVHLIPRAEVSTSLTLTAEDAHLFATSILENLRVARRDVSEEEAAGLLVKAGLGPWLAELPDGVHTVLGAEATTVSGGERRRLLLARALASAADFLLIDEPAEHLDGETADALIRDLAATEGKTVILVSHRLTALEGVDSVVVLDKVGEKARVLAQGAHDELAASLPAYRWSLSREESRR